MAEFLKTQDALADLYANSNFGVGEHIKPSPSTGDPGQVLGYVSFDPTVHDMEDIDPLAFAEDDSEGNEHFVQEVLPDKPLNMTNVQDLTQRSGAKVLQAQKTEVIKTIVAGLDGSLVGSTDYAHLGIADGNDRGMFVDQTVDSLDYGLTFGVSDFHRVEFGDGESLDGLVAIKVNHLLERSIPANVGFISLGGTMELNTGNERDLRNFNELLQEQHDRTVGQLEGLGAHVVSVVVDPRLENGFDVARADADIASALEAMTR